jgi:hypothetical protein
MPMMSRRAMLTAATLLAAPPALISAARAQAAATPAPTPGFVPRSGMAGKDVVWVPTPQALVDRMLDMAELRPDDVLVDLGSGDGRTVITAARRGTPSLGIEYNPDLVALSKQAAEKEGVADKARFIHGDIFKTDFSQATVVTLFLLPSLNLRLRPTLLDMKPGTRVVSNTFTMEEWPEDDKIEAGEACESYCRAFLWIVPAKVEGAWKLPQGELRLRQTFQMLYGEMVLDGRTAEIKEGRMRGEEIRLTVNGSEYTGRVQGDSMTLAAAGGQSLTATRAR